MRVSHEKRSNLARIFALDEKTLTRHVMEAKLVIVLFANCVKCMSYDDTPPYERENFLKSRLEVLLKLAVGILSGINAPSYGS